MPCTEYIIKIDAIEYRYIHVHYVEKLNGCHVIRILLPCMYYRVGKILTYVFFDVVDFKISLSIGKSG